MSGIPFSLVTARRVSAPPTFNPLDHFITCDHLYLGEENWGVIEGSPDRIDTIENAGSYAQTLTAFSAGQRPEVSTLNDKPSPLYQLASNDGVRRQFGASYFPDDGIELYTAIVIQREHVAANDYAFDFEGIYEFRVNGAGTFRFRTKRTDDSFVAMNFGDATTNATLLVELNVDVDGEMSASVNGGTPTTNDTNAFGLLCSGVDRMGLGNNTNGTSAFGGKIPMFLARIGRPSAADRLAMRNAAYAYYGFSGS